MFRRASMPAPRFACLWVHVLWGQFALRLRRSPFHSGGVARCILNDLWPSRATALPSHLACAHVTSMTVLCHQVLDAGNRTLREEVATPDQLQNHIAKHQRQADELFHKKTSAALARGVTRH